MAGVIYSRAVDRSVRMTGRLNPRPGINRPIEDMIPIDTGPDRTLMAPKPAPPADDHAWTAFEAEALPHGDRLFRLALWFERNRHEAEDSGAGDDDGRRSNRFTGSSRAPTAAPGW